METETRRNCRKLELRENVRKWAGVCLKKKNGWKPHGQVVEKKIVEVCLSWSGAPPFCWPRGVGEPQVQLRSRVHGPGAGDPFLPPIPPPQCSPPPSPCRRVAMSSPVSTPPPERLGEYRDCLIPARRGSYYGSPSVPGPSLRDRRQATLVQ